jgi:hypothetical protein
MGRKKKKKELRIKRQTYVDSEIQPLPLHDTHLDDLKHPHQKYSRTAVLWLQ